MCTELCMMYLVSNKMLKPGDLCLDYRERNEAENNVSKK